MPLRVLLTGASGNIGRCLAADFRARYDLRTFDRRPDPSVPALIVGDLTDPVALRAAMANIEVVVHLAAVPKEEDFVSRLLPANLLGFQHTLEAARQAGVRRVVFASTAQTVAEYPPDQELGINVPVRPCSVYAVTKIFGEALGRFYHDAHGLEFVAIRIGWFAYPDHPQLTTHPGMRAIWLSPRDAVRLFVCAIERPSVGYALVYGTSRTPFERLSLQPARELLGYEPVDDLTKTPA